MIHNSYFKQSGFTLIELLVVISIIALLSSVIFTSVNEVRRKARDTRRIADFRQFVNALELFYDTYRAYPCGDFDWAGITIDSSDSPHFLDGNNDPPLLVNCIGDPKFGIYTAGFYSRQTPKDPINVWGQHIYMYNVSLNRQEYILFVRLEVNPTRMENDGGLCNNVYETGSGLGIMTPLDTDITNGVPCN